MTDICFHFGVEDRTVYACRLLRKALRQGARLLVRGEGTEIDLLDKALWTFEPQEFLAHHRLRAHEALAPRLRRTPVWLMDESDVWPKDVLEDLPGSGVLVHMGALPCEDAPRWARVIELVSVDAEDRLQARQRWRAYEARGWAPHGLNVGVNS